jgi:hypothetical protein
MTLNIKTYFTMTLSEPTLCIAAIQIKTFNKLIIMILSITLNLMTRNIMTLNLMTLNIKMLYTKVLSIMPLSITTLNET